MKTLTDLRQGSNNGIDDPIHWKSSITLIRHSIAAQLIGSSSYIVALRILAPDQVARLGGSVVAFLIAIVGWYLLSRRQVQAAAKFQAYGLWAIVTTVGMFVGGVRAPLVIIYPVVIMVMGWLLGSRSAMVMTVLALASTLGFLAAELQGVLPPSLPSSTMLYGVVQIVLCLLSWMLIHRVIDAYQDRMKESKKTSAHLSKLAQDLHDSNTRLSAIFQASPICIIISKVSDDIILDLNNATVQQFGCDRDEVIGKRTTADLGVYTNPAQRTGLVNQLSGCECVDQLQINCRTHSGKQIVLAVSARIIDLHGEPCRLSMMVDVTDRQRAEEAIHEKAFHDSLTGLPNRRLLADRLHQTMSAARRSRCYGALMFLDLDNFKTLNDVHGHDVGDLLLIEVARRLSSGLREMDTVARVGGDEFVLLLSELSHDQSTSRDRALAVAEKMRASLALPYLLKPIHEGDATFSVEHYCTGSIGVALFVNDDSSGKEAMHCADVAMYRAKRSGGNSISFHASTNHAQPAPRLAVQEDSVAISPAEKWDHA